MKKVKVTPENITKLKGKEIFVFGSNLAGMHGGGAAKFAQEKFGAISGQGIGLFGKSYALPTKDENIETMPIDQIAKHVNDLREYTITWKSLHFMITAVGCGLAGYEPKDIAPLFKDFLELDNVSLPQSFLDILSVEETIPGFKGFGKDLKCRDFQYEFNKDYEIEGDVKACNHGFHFCEHPLNVFEYYPPAESRFASVVGSGKVSREEGGDTKVAVSKIHIGAEISLESLTKAAVKFVFDRAKWTEGVVASKDNEGVSISGDQGAATASGYQGAAVSLGIEAIAKGNIGCWITLSEWQYNGEWNRIDVQTKKVDGEIIKADTFYKLVGGEFVEA